MTLDEAKQVIKDVKVKLARGEDYRKCKEEAAPAIAVLNEEGARIAKKYNKRFKPLSFAGIMR